MDVTLLCYPSRWRLGMRLAGGLVLFGVIGSASQHGLWTAGVGWLLLLIVVCAVFGWMWWQQTAWPVPYSHQVRFHRQRWWFLRDDEWRMAPVRPSFQLFGLIGIPHPHQRRHVWIFRDECSYDDWRRLTICVRFNVSDRA